MLSAVSVLRELEADVTVEGAWVVVKSISKGVEVVWVIVTVEVTVEATWVLVKSTSSGVDVVCVTVTVNVEANTLVAMAVTVRIRGSQTGQTFEHEVEDGGEEVVVEAVEAVVAMQLQALEYLEAS